MLSLRSRFRGALLGGFVGDALGRPFEGSTASDARLATEPRARAAGADTWLYTDDTEMTIGVAESIVRRGALDAEDLLATLAREHEPARGYGKGMRMIFDAVAGGTSARRAAFVPWKEGSRGNGAAARVAPVACLHHEDPAALEAVAEESAGITHAHPIGRAGCVLQAIALGQALTLHAPGKLDGEAFLSSLSTRIAPRSPALASKLLQAATLLAGPWSPRTVAAALGNGVVADESVPLAIFAFAAWFPSFDEVVLRAIECGGDTDTIGAMSGALAGAALGEEGIPAPWIENLENGRRGRDHVIALADEIHRLRGTRRPDRLKYHA